MYERVARAHSAQAPAAPPTRQINPSPATSASGRWHRFDRIAIEPSRGAGSAGGVLQLKWNKVRGTENDYYWDGPGQPDGPPPDGGNPVQAPRFEQLEDTHSSRRGGSMKSLRTVPDTPETGLNLLAHLGSQAASQKGIYYPGPLEWRGLGDVPVRTTVPHRVTGEHTKIFRQMTGGEPSSTKYQQSLGTAEPNTTYDIQHGAGHGEVGKVAQDARNLGSASSGSNSLMIPSDKQISGNPNVLVQTQMGVRPGTQRVEVTRQQYAYSKYPDVPIFRQDIDGDMPKPTRSQYEQMETDTEYLKEPDIASGAEMLLNLKGQSAFGRLGRWAPGNHPADRRFGSNDKRDDDDDMIL